MSESYTLEPVHLESTASIIARRLRRAIMYGSLPAGSQLAEAELAAQFRVSRGPLREAMQRLVQEACFAASATEGSLSSRSPRRMFGTSTSRGRRSSELP